MLCVHQTRTKTTGGICVCVCVCVDHKILKASVFISNGKSSLDHFTLNSNLNYASNEFVD